MKHKKILISLCLVMVLIASSTLCVIGMPSNSATKKESGGGIRTITVGGYLWMYTGYTAPYNSTGTAFFPEREIDPYYVFICQPVIPLVPWAMRDLHLPNGEGMLVFNMNHVQALQLGGSVTLPWKVFYHRFYWCRDLDPETGYAYIITERGALDETPPDGKNTSVIAPVILVPKG